MNFSDAAVEFTHSTMYSIRDFLGVDEVRIFIIIAHFHHERTFIYPDFYVVGRNNN